MKLTLQYRPIPELISTDMTKTTDIDARYRQYLCYKLFANRDTNTDTKILNHDNTSAHSSSQKPLNSISLTLLHFGLYTTESNKHLMAMYEMKAMSREQICDTKYPTLQEVQYLIFLLFLSSSYFKLLSNLSFEFGK